MGSGEPARVLRALADEEPVRHRRHRSTKRWCGGKPGIEHTPAIRLDRYRASLRQHPDPQFGGMRECAWVNRRWHRTQPWHWRCWHQRYCTTCGKIIDRQLRPQECPDYAPHSC